MTATVQTHEMAPAAGNPAGVALVVAGAIGTTWATWTAAKVHSVLQSHVDLHGEVPESPLERAALYGNGTDAEQQLSSDLEGLTGVYPYGWLPLVLSLGLVIGGWALLWRRNRAVAVFGIVVTLAVGVGVIALYGGSLTTALDILE